MSSLDSEAKKATGARGRRLILAPCSYINPEEDIVVGPWCFRGKEYEISWPWQKWEPDPFTSTDSLASAERITFGAALTLLEQLIPELNRRNGTNHGAIFWDILLMPWLLTLVHVVYEHEQRICNLVEKYREVPLEVELIDGPTRWGFADTDGFFREGIFTDTFNHWLFSETIRAISPDTWTLRSKNVETPPLQKPGSPTFRERMRKRFAAFRFSAVYGTSITEQLFFSLLLALKPAIGPVSIRPTETRAAPLEWRCDILKIALASLPRCFDSLFMWAPRHVSVKAGKVGINNGYNFDEPKKYCAALRAEAGEHLLDGQHGGNYGNMRVSPMHHAAEYRRGPFLSWGWTRQGSYTVDVIPLPSPYLSKMHRGKIRTGEIIFVGAYQNSYCYRIMSATQPAQQAAYVADKLAFIGELDVAARARLVYRPYPDSLGGFSEAAFMRSHVPDVTICGGEFHSRLMGADLVVLDHPGTTMNICIAVGIPLICFWDHDIWAMCDESEPLFEGLRGAGILHKDCRAAARQVNMVIEDISRWWNDQTTAEARNSWGHVYARTSKHWGRNWFKTLLDYNGRSASAGS